MTTSKNFSHRFPELVVQEKGEAVHTNKSFANYFLKYPQNERNSFQETCLS